MYIVRDISSILQSESNLEAVILWGPRQVGKTTVLDHLPLKSKIFPDDLVQRQKANVDPGLFLDHIELPCLLDEVQYAPNLFYEIKKRIDQERREKLKKNNNEIKTQYYLTGSNQTSLDKFVKESMAGRSQLLTLHGLSIRTCQKISAHFRIQFFGHLKLLLNRKILDVAWLHLRFRSIVVA